MPEAPDVKLSIRLPADMHATLTEQAKREERSLNGQIVYLLRQTITTGTSLRRTSGRAVRGSTYVWGNRAAECSLPR